MTGSRRPAICRRSTPKTRAWADGTEIGRSGTVKTVKFHTDENVAEAVAQGLRRRGFDV